MSRFETEVLTQDGNVEGLDRLNAAPKEWFDSTMVEGQPSSGSRRASTR